MIDHQIFDDDWIVLSHLILDSYRHWLNDDLVDRSGTDLDQAEQMYYASHVILAHGTEDDPILCYGNLAALELWETDLATLLQMPSRMTAEPQQRDDRTRMLQAGLQKGFIQNYSGIRISTTGRRFQIDQATVWTLLDGRGQRVGQAATFSDWKYLEEIG